LLAGQVHGCGDVAGDGDRMTIGRKEHPHHFGPSSRQCGSS
jgi:hypothetical protein